jgi:putative transposase
MVIGGRILEPAAVLARREAVTAAEEVTPAPANVPRIEPSAPAKTRSQMSAAEIYAEWLAVEARMQAGETVSQEDQNFYQRWPNGAQGRAFFKRLATA